MFEVNDNLRSKVNSIFSGYYKVTKVTEKDYSMKAFESDGSPSFSSDKYGIYKKSKKWVEKNMVKICE